MEAVAMRRLLAPVLAPFAATLLASTLLAATLQAPPTIAAGLRLTPAKAHPFPERAYLLTLPGKSSLSANQVTVTENGSAVSDLSLVPASSIGESHFGTVVMIETSASMHGAAIRSALAAARSFAAQRSAQQPLGVVEFDSQSREVLPLSTDGGAISRVLSATPLLGSGTHIFNAVSTGLQMLSRANVTAGTIVLLSDGALTGRLSEQASRQRKAQVISAAVAQNVRVYAIGVHDAAFNAASLESLAKSAGGTYTEVNSAQLPALLRELGTELSNQYLIRYRSLVSPATKVEVAAHVSGQAGGALASYSTPALKPIVGAPASTHTPFLQTTLAALLASALCAALIGLAVIAILTPRKNVRERIGRFVTTSSVELPKSWTGTLLERAFPTEESGLKRQARWAKFVEDVELARVGLSPEQLLTFTAVGTVLLGWVLLAASGSVIAALFALCFPVGVRIAVQVVVDRRRREFDEQLPDNLQVIAAAMRAGHTFVGALALVAEDAPQPSRGELRRVLADEQLGIPLGDALNAVTERMKSRDFEHVALVAALQRETGGNTAEVIDTVTETIRERLDLRRLVRALTAQGRLAGWVVSSLPVALLLFISLINPHYVHPLFHRTVGVVALVIAAIMLMAGFLVIRRIVNIKV
jgi:tight adherence protein B